MTKERVSELLEEGRSVSEIASLLALSKSTVCYHARRLGVGADARFGRRYNWAEIAAYYAMGHTARECRERFGCSSSAWRDAVDRGGIPLRSDAQEIAVLVSRARPLSRGQLKRLLIRSGLKTGKCERCGLGEWRGRPLSIALHHVNGRPRDNRLENLRLLCPNCHSQTENYGGRNRQRRASEIAA
jgi:hypothetical protein